MVGSALEEWPELPKLLTAVPGPRSQKTSGREAKFRTTGCSAGAQWASLDIVAGNKTIVKDADGNYLLDACAGTVVMNIGHGNKSVSDAVAEQCSQLTHFYDFPSEQRLLFLEELAKITPQSCECFLLVNSGAEAIEAALRVARSATGRYEVISFKNGYHGRTFGALSLTSGAGRKGVGPMLPGVYITEAPTGLSTEPTELVAEKTRVSLEAIENLINNVCTNTPAAIFIEPVQGAGGSYPMPHEFLRRLRNLCDEKGILLVFDEILCGAGRTGRMWAHEHSGVVPDLLVAGKGMAGGLPFGMVGGRIDVLNAGSMGMATRNSSTFGGNPVVCAAGHKTIDVLTNQGLIENARLIGDQLITNLRTRLMNLRCVKDIRGLGLLIGAEIHSPPKGPISMDDMLRAILMGLLEHGVVISSSSPVIRITPPLTLTQNQANYIAEALEKVLIEVIEPKFSVS